MYVDEQLIVHELFGGEQIFVTTTTTTITTTTTTRPLSLPHYCQFKTKL